MDFKQAADIVVASIHEINLSRDADEQIATGYDAVLYGSTGALDSLGLVELILAVEERVDTELGLSLTLADDKALSQEHSPFRSVRSLSEYLCSSIKERSDGKK